MWVVLSGSIGTAKEELAKNLESQNFDYLSFDYNECETEYDFIANRYILSSEIDPKNNFVTVRSVHDSLVFALAKLKCNLINDSDYKKIVETVENFTNLKTPDVFILAKTENRMDSMNRLAMKYDEIVNDTFLKTLDEEYEKYYEMIGVPKFEINTSKPLNLVLEDFNFYMSSIKTTKLNEETIWRKDFLNEIWMG